LSLVGNAWGLSIANAIIAASSGMNDDEKDTLREGWQLIASAHVDYITSNAEINTNVSGQATGVMSGTATAPTTGTGSGTIS